MYDKTTIHSIIFILCILAYLVSPKTDLSIPIQEVQASEATQTGEIGELPVSTQTGKVEKGLDSPIQDTKQAHSNVKEVKTECDTTCKVNTLVSLGIEARIANGIVYTCKSKAKDARHCIIVTTSIMGAESSLGKRCSNYGCFGIRGGKAQYKSYEEGIEDFVNRYTKWWYKAQSASFFYPSAGQVSRSRYCTSEKSSGTDVGCPNGQKHAQSVWNKLDKLF